MQPCDVNREIWSERENMIQEYQIYSTNSLPTISQIMGVQERVLEPSTKRKYGQLHKIKGWGEG